MASLLSKKRAPYRIETERLVLRPYEPDDSDSLRTTCARNKEHLSEYMPWARFDPQTVDDKLELILGFRGQFDSGGNYVYGIFDAKSKDLIGGAGFHPRLEGGEFEVGYWITAESEGQGYVSEAMRALCHVGFEGMGLDILGVRMEPGNGRSERVAQKLGFVREGLLRRALRFAPDPPKDVLRYTLLDSEYQTLDWRESNAAKVRMFDALSREIEL